jgi:hypothetical protein
MSARALARASGQWAVISGQFLGVAANERERKHVWCERSLFFAGPAYGVFWIASKPLYLELNVRF